MKQDRAYVVSFDAGIRMVLAKMLTELGYEVQVLKYISAIDKAFDGVVMYHNRAFSVHHMHACVTIVENAEFVFLGHFNSDSHPRMVNVPFSQGMVERALSEIAA